MERYSKIPLLFFFIAASLGLLLRWYFISPLEFIPYPFLLHTHSHIMFLGWVFNALYFAFIFSYLKEKWNSRYRLLFILLQVLVVGMLIFFPLQGYGMFSIILSTLHTVTAGVFTMRFFNDVRKLPLKNSTSLKAIRIALAFLLLSTLGPFAVGVITSNGLGQSQWYYFAVYYYLHFQYNGFFLFGILGLFFKLLEDRNIPFSQLQANRAINWMAAACIPCYLLSILWANPGVIFNIISFVSAVVQLLALALFVHSIHQRLAQVQTAINPVSFAILLIVFWSLLLKELLQLISAHPVVAQLSYEFRTYVMAYLHLVLVGIITLFMLFWYAESNLINLSWYKTIIFLIFIGLIGMELLLIAAPLLSALQIDPISVQKGILLFSILIWGGAGCAAFSSLHTTKR